MNSSTNKLTKIIFAKRTVKPTTTCYYVFKIKGDLQLKNTGGKLNPIKIILIISESLQILIEFPTFN